MDLVKNMEIVLTLYLRCVRRWTNSVSLSDDRVRRRAA
jgi:hypothetical protein